MILQTAAVPIANFRVSDAFLDCFEMLRATHIRVLSISSLAGSNSMFAGRYRERWSFFFS